MESASRLRQGCLWNFLLARPLRGHWGGTARLPAFRLGPGASVTFFGGESRADLPVSPAGLRGPCGKGCPGPTTGSPDTVTRPVGSSVDEAGSKLRGRGRRRCWLRGRPWCCPRVPDFMSPPTPPPGCWGHRAGLHTSQGRGTCLVPPQLGPRRQWAQPLPGPGG